ncbi:MAG: hypothetical protein ORN21_04635 [Methylophilaceae bacterium]|nr:hypothetical protein [Methylophilaceae bacterium]
MAESVNISFARLIYDVEAIQKATYKAMNFITLDIQLTSTDIQCLLTPNIGGGSEAQFSHAVEEFKKEVLDQQLRIKLKAETESVRNLILGIAFSNTDLQGDG